MGTTATKILCASFAYTVLIAERTEWKLVEAPPEQVLSRQTKTNTEALLVQRVFKEDPFRRQPSA